MTNIDSGTPAVAGAGPGRTGMHSLEVALEQLLGGPSHHLVEVCPSDEQRAGWTLVCPRADMKGQASWDRRLDRP